MKNEYIVPPMEKIASPLLMQPFRSDSALNFLELAESFGYLSQIREDYRPYSFLGHQAV